MIVDNRIRTLPTMVDHVELVIGIESVDRNTLVDRMILLFLLALSLVTTP